MQVELRKPEMERFINEKVNSGDFPSPEAVVEDALNRMMQDEQSLSNQDIRAINQAEEQMDNSEHVDFDDFAARMKNKYCNKNQPE